MTKQFAPSTNNKQVDAYVPQRSLKQHELELLDIVQARVEQIPVSRITSLDIGCSDGLFARKLKSRFQNWQVEGLEINENLIEQGKHKNCSSDITVHQGDAYAFVPKKAYDVITASGVLAIFDDPLSVLDQWLKWLKPGGELFVFSIFNAGDIDTRVSFRNNFSLNGWETGLTGYSIQSIQRHLDCLKVKYEFIAFEIGIDLPKVENPIRSYTVCTNEGKRLVIAGNILCEFYYLVIRKLDE